MAYKKIYLGGEGELWSVIYSIQDVNNDDYRGIRGSIEFMAKDDAEAKNKILNYFKKVVASMRKTRGRFLMIQAVPLMRDGERFVGDGNRMLRNKHRYSDKRLLRMKDPDKVFVQGYGPEAQEKLYE